MKTKYGLMLLQDTMFLFAEKVPGVTALPQNVKNTASKEKEEETRESRGSQDDAKEIKFP